MSFCLIFCLETLMFDDYWDKILNCTYVGQGYTGVMFSSSRVYCRVTDNELSNMLFDVGGVNTLKRKMCIFWTI